MTISGFKTPRFLSMAIAVLIVSACDDDNRSKPNLGDNPPSEFSEPSDLERVQGDWEYTHFKLAQTG